MTNGIPDHREIKSLQRTAIEGDRVILQGIRHMAQGQAELCNMLGRLLDEGEEREKRYQKTEQSKTAIIPRFS